MHIQELRTQVGQEIIDYNQLKDALKDYAHPRGVISHWLKTGKLIRVKKGLYIFGPGVARAPFSSLILANLIYGPSAISLHSALSYYGLIPEAVYTVTSITNKRKKSFDTPVGKFNYYYLNRKRYSVGIQLLTLDNHINFFIATPEKALCDMLLLSTKNLIIQNMEDFEYLVYDDLRLDTDLLRQLNKPLLNNLAHCYQQSRVTQFVNYFNQWTT